MTGTTEYEQGLRDGRLRAIEAMQVEQNERMDSHERRIQSAERIQHGLLGAIVLVQIIPMLEGIIT